MSPEPFDFQDYTSPVTPPMAVLNNVPSSTPVQTGIIEPATLIDGVQLIASLGQAAGGGGLQTEIGGVVVVYGDQDSEGALAEIIELPGTLADGVQLNAALGGNS